MVPSKILCIGRNYAGHAAELSNPLPSAPIVFLKPPSALIGSGDEILLPGRSSEVHHEVELVVRLGRKGKSIPAREAMFYVDGYAVGLDLTARDLQSDAKKKGYPWSVSKGFDTFAPLGSFCRASDIADPHDLEISLEINGQIRQSGNTSDMIFSISTLIEYLSGIFTLMPGDLIYTGTPEGVGIVLPGDELNARISGLPELKVRARSDQR